ncbi:MAG: dihydroorotase [Saprospiraceae bacterium]|nr:dihydroorotase [Saprospiraceae bacterium]
MKILIRKATIIDRTSEYHNKVMDILVSDAVILRIGQDLPAAAAAEVIEMEGLFVSPGWVDLGVQVGDPGFEHREDLDSVAQAAAAGGFTGIGPFPNTEPVIQAKPEVNYLLQKTHHSVLDIYPIGAITRNCKGLDITEMIDMHKVGAVAFSDGHTSIQNNGMMMRALQYVKAFGGIVINHPHDISIAGEGQIHEGYVSTALGMKGIPDMAEEMMVQRDIYLAEYTNSRVHISGISSRRSVDLIRGAKSRGIAVSCSVPVLNLVFTDQMLLDFNAQFKVLPPLRQQEDVEGLRAGLLDGTIDMITSNHVPLEVEQKQLEFAYAGFGAIGLETAYALANTHFGDKLGQEGLVTHFSRKPRQIFGLPEVVLQEGSKATLTLFQPDLSWTFKLDQRYSKSANSPLNGQVLKGKVVGIINKGRSFFRVNP